MKSPYIVDQFITTNDMNVVWQDQRDIIEEYRDDFGKHLDENENEEIDLTLLARINRVFESIPAQLAKENKKFVFSVLEKKGRSENYLPADISAYKTETIPLVKTETAQNKIPAVRKTGHIFSEK